MIQHPYTFPVGTYVVSCLYGTAASTVNTMTAGTDTATMTVKDGTQGTVQGCDKIYSYVGNTLSTSMQNSSSFNASFVCGSRTDLTSVNDPVYMAYRLAIDGIQPSFLVANTANVLSSLGIGFGSTQTQQYTISNSVGVSCAAKVGVGYSTNDSCKLKTYVGGDGPKPQTFIVTPSHNQICTNHTTAVYDIGCNEDSADYAQCANWFNTGSAQTINMGGAARSLTCTAGTPPGAFGPVKTCTVVLPTGGAPVTIFAGDRNSFQTTVYTLTSDTQAPTGSIAYYTNYSAGTQLNQSQYTSWQKQPTTAVITCTDQPGTSDGSNCACAPTLQGDTNNLWSPGLRSTIMGVGPDVMTYSRLLYENSANLYSVNVQDTAGNIGPAFAPQIGIDTVPPKVTGSISGNNVTLSAVDPGAGSGLWKANVSLPDPTATGIKENPNSVILYHIAPKGSAPVFGTSCLSISNQLNYYTFGSSGAKVSDTTSITLPDLNSAVEYCVEDNAGNVTHGFYPSDLTGCFSASNMSTVPTLQSYKPLLTARITGSNPIYGYGLSESPDTATCFRGILASNINTYIKNQYLPSASPTIDWNTQASLTSLANTSNTNGYYYYDRSNIPGNTVIMTTSPTGTGQKVVLAEGTNIQINTNINYSNSDKILVIIAHKNSSGTGGNIYIDPSVTHIDAILIADGDVENGVTTNTASGTTTLVKDWINNPNDLSNRLTINGRIYSFNTRGGSLNTDLTQIT